MNYRPVGHKPRRDFSLASKDVRSRGGLLWTLSERWVLSLGIAGRLIRNIEVADCRISLKKAHGGIKIGVYIDGVKIVCVDCVKIEGDFVSPPGTSIAEKSRACSDSAKTVWLSVTLKNPTERFISVGFLYLWNINGCSSYVTIRALLETRLFIQERRG